MRIGQHIKTKDGLVGTITKVFINKLNGWKEDVVVEWENRPLWASQTGIVHHQIIVEVWE